MGAEVELKNLFGVCGVKDELLQPLCVFLLLEPELQHVCLDDRKYGQLTKEKLLVVMSSLLVPVKGHVGKNTGV